MKATLVKLQKKSIRILRWQPHSGYRDKSNVMFAKFIDLNFAKDSRPENVVSDLLTAASNRQLFSAHNIS